MPQTYRQDVQTRKDRDRQTETHRNKSAKDRTKHSLRQRRETGTYVRYSGPTSQRGPKSSSSSSPCIFFKCRHFSEQISLLSNDSSRGQDQSRHPFHKHILNPRIHIWVQAKGKPLTYWNNLLERGASCNLFTDTRECQS